MVNEFNNSVSQLLYQLSSLLMLPVMVLVVGLFVWTMAAVGGFVREWMERAAIRKAFAEAISCMEEEHGETRHKVWEILSQTPSGVARQFAMSCSAAASELAERKVLLDLENDIAGKLGRLGFVAKVGPMLGLLGTLIPFGPALAGLSSGDIRELSANLVTAFATTVVGLLCGSVAFALAAVRKGWYGRDFDELEYILEYLKKEQTHEATQDEEVGRSGGGSEGRRGRRSHGRTGQPV